MVDKTTFKLINGNVSIALEKNNVVGNIETSLVFF